MSNLATLIREAERMRSSTQRPILVPEPSLLHELQAHDFQEDHLHDLPSRVRYHDEMDCAPMITARGEAVVTVHLTEEQMEQLRSAIAPPPEVMTLTEAAGYLRVGRNSILDLVHESGLPAAKLAGKWRFKRSTLDRWIEQEMCHSHATNV